MRQADKMAKIRYVLENAQPPVMTMAQIATHTGLNYRQVQRALLLHFRSEYAKTPSTHEFRAIGSNYQEYIYSKKRCDSPVGAK